MMWQRIRRAWLCFVLNVLIVGPVLGDNTHVTRLRDTFYPGTTGNQVSVVIRNESDYPTPVFVPKPQLPLLYVEISSIEPASAQLGPGEAVEFLITFDIAPSAPAGSGEAVTVFFTMGQSVRARRLDLIVDFVESAAPPVTDLLPDLEVVEIRESFAAGTVGNAVVFRVENTTAFPVVGLNLRPELPAQYLTLDGIDPRDIDLEPGEVIEITAEFSVRADAEVGAEDVIGFHFEAESENPVPIPYYRLVALIEAGEEVDEPGTEAACNSAVDSGGDEGGGVTVDLGGFVGKAGFSWEMFDIKDQMDVTVGSIAKTTGCVSGSGTIEFDVPPGADVATVKVVPNCEGTSGTAWNFTFECPLSSTVTADGSGNALPGADADTQTADADGGPGGTAPTSGHGVEGEPNDRIDSASAIAPPASFPAGIQIRGDVDFYQVDLVHQGELRVGFSGVPAEIDPSFRVLDEYGSQVWGWQGARENGKDFEAWADIAAPGRYVIEVRDGGNSASSNQDFTTTVGFTPTHDTDEPNNDIKTASVTPFGRTVAANILPRGDADHYAIDVPHQGELTVDFSTSPAALDMAFRVLDENGRQVWGWQGASAAGEPFASWADLKSPGPYIVEVRDGGNSARAAEPYQMTISLDQTADTDEPNDDLANAAPLAFGAPIKANILPRGDADLYAIDVSHQGELTVDFSTSPAALDMAFRVLDENGRQVWGWQGASAAGEPFASWADLKAPGRYIVEVRDGGNSARAPEPYEMTVTLDQTADTDEPNDDLASATPLAFGAPIKANILPRGDADHYAIDVPHQGELTVGFSTSPAALDMAFRVLDGNGRQVWGWQGASAAGEPFASWADLKSPGPYIVEVRDGGNSARAPEPYEMTVSLDQTADTAEPNDDLANATPILFDKAIQANILPRGDGDLYTIDIAQQGELTVEFSASPAELDMAFRVLDAKGSQVWGWQGAREPGAPHTSWADLKTPGRYLIEVRDGGNSARSAEPYTMVASFTPTSDAAEPNDELAKAATLSLGQAVSANILPRGDADMYRFDMPRAGKILVSFDTAPAELDMAFRVLDQAGSQVWGWQGAPAPGEPFSATAELPATGTYLIEIRDGGNSARSSSPYGFRVSLQ